MLYSSVSSSAIVLLFLVTDTILNQIYNIIHEKADLVSYQKDLFSDEIEFTVKKLNSSHISFCLRFTMAADIVDQKMMLRISIDKLFGSEYKRTGTSVNGNVCSNWERNVFGIKNMISKYGNIDACQLKKGTYYHLDNFVPDVSNFPKILPYGGYKLILDFYYQNSTKTSPILLLHYYARVEKVLKF